MIALFLLVSFISFIGSVHPGAVNVAVVQTTLTQSRRAGLWLALGGSLPEIVYSCLAVRGVSLLNLNTTWLTGMQLLSVPVLLVAGMASFRQKKPSVGPVHESVVKHAFPFWRGLVLAATNPQLLPFWSAVWFSLSSTMLLAMNRQQSQWVFIVATSVGAFALLTAMVWLADRHRPRLSRFLNHYPINHLTGATFIGMACWQVVQLW